ncbi:U32 family peptidase C-terminal domain-containing protein, partial [Streptococcus salivarius]
LKISHRPYTTGFFEHRPEADGQVYTTSSYEQTADFVGLVNDYDAASGRVTLEQRNNVKEGETLEILTPGGTVFPWTLSDMEDETGTPI